MDTLLDRIKLACEEKGIKNFTQLELLCGITPKSIRRWDENTPSVDRVNIVANYLGVSVDYLIGNTDIKNPAEHLTQQEQDILDLIRNDPALRAYVLDLQYRRTHDSVHPPATNETT